MALSENDHKDRYRENIVVRVLSPLSQATVIPRQFCRKTTKPALRKIAGFSHGGLRKPGGGLISVMVPVPQHVWVQRLGQPTEGSFILQALHPKQSQSKTIPVQKKCPDRIGAAIPVSGLSGSGTRPAKKVPLCQGAGGLPLY